MDTLREVDVRIPFVGRDLELSLIADALTEGRVVTLVGAGGSGKSRLALQAAARSGVDFTFVSLVGTAEGGVFDAIAHALDAREAPGVDVAEAIGAALRATPRAILVDNCEHVLDEARNACSQMAAIPGVRVLATSRHKLGLDRETILDVGVLPPEDALAFVLACLRVKDPDFAPDRLDDDRIAAIAGALDGLPIAIDLAIARYPTITLAQLARELRRIVPSQFRTTHAADPRHQTLERTIEWSTSLLSETAQTLFAASVTFSGWFDAEDVRAVGAPQISPADAAAALEELADHSLLLRLSSGRYTVLAPVRAVARRRADALRGAATFAQRHTIRMRDNVVRLGDRFASSDLLQFVASVGDRYDDYRAALDWTLHHAERLRIGVELVRPLTSYWGDRGRLAEGLRWTRRALDVAENAGTLDPQEVGHLTYAYLRMCYAAGDYVEMLEQGPSLIGAFTRVGDRLSLGRAYNLLSVASLSLGEVDDAEKFGETAVALHRAIGHPRGVASALCNLGNVALEGRLDANAALAHYGHALDLAMQPGGEAIRVLIHGNSAEALYNLGRLNEAERSCEFSLEASERLGNEAYRAWGFEILARIWLAQGEQLEAAQALRTAIDYLMIEPGAEYVAAACEIAGRLALARDAAAESARLFFAARRFRTRHRLMQIGPAIAEANAAFAQAAGLLNPQELAGSERESETVASSPELLAAARASLEVGVAASGAWYDEPDTTNQEHELG
jgi:predicted ATPase